MLVLSLAALALTASAPMEDCPRLDVESAWGSDDRLMPEVETFHATVRYTVPWQSVPTADCVPSPSCFQFPSQIHFTVDQAPQYATVDFDPESATIEANPEKRQGEATTQLTIQTTRDAPAFEDGKYAIRAAGCGHPMALATFALKNDYFTETSIAAQEPLVQDGNAPGIPNLPMAAVAVAAVLAAWLRRTV